MELQRPYAVNKDYVVINKASFDRNHGVDTIDGFIEQSLKIVQRQMETYQYRSNSRARRPIIEFEAGLKLWNFGTSSKGIIDLIDDKTTDVMSNVEGLNRIFC